MLLPTATIGVLLKSVGKNDSAISHYREAIFIDPEYADAYTNLGNALSSLKGQRDDAIRYYQKALQLQPDSAGTHFNLAIALQKVDTVPPKRCRIIARQFSFSRHTVRRTATRPGFWRLTSTPRYETARKQCRLAQMACQLTQFHPIPLKSLAAGLAETGDFAKAAETIQQSIQRANEAGNTALASQGRQFLSLLQQQQPIRDAR